MKYDLLSIHEKTQSLQIEGNEVTSLKKSDLQKHGLRRYENGRIFQASRIGPSSRDQLLKDSREWAGEGIACDYDLAPAHSENRKSKAKIQNLLAEFEAEVSRFMAEHKNFVFSGKCIQKQVQTSLTSDYGLDLRASGDHLEWYLVYQKIGSGNMFDGAIDGEGSNVDIAKALANHEAYLKAQESRGKIRSKRLPVLLADSLSPLAKFKESIDMRKYKEGHCHFSGRLGEVLFSKEVNLIDQAYNPEQGHHQFFDGEGVVREKDNLYLIKNGEFSALIADLRTAHKYEVQSTGNGVRSYKGGVNLLPRKLVLEKRDQPWREMIKDLDQCLVAAIAAGGESNDLGEFSSPVQVGYLFEKGDLVGMAPQLTIKTRIEDYLGKDLIGISGDDFFGSGGPSGAVVAEMDVFVN